jgi:hypothetical protein
MFDNFPYDRKAYRLLKECSDKQDLSEWNQYRKDTNNEPINLKLANLSNFYLVGANLSYVDMSGADLSDANLSGADVGEANISFNFSWKLFIAIFMIAELLFEVLYFGLDIPVKKDLVAVAGDTVGGALVGGALVAVGVVGSGVGLFFSIFKQNQRDIAKAKNPIECIGFNLKYLEPTDIDIIKEENQQLKEQLKEISDEELKKSIEAKLAKNEENIVALIEQQTAKSSYELKVKNLLTEIQKPYKYLKTHTYIQYGLILFFVVIIALILYLGVVYTQSFYLARENTFTNLFNKATIPEFGTLFGVIVFYGTPVLLAIAIMVYLFSKINHSLDKITAYQSKEQKIMELIAIIKAKIVLGLEEDEFKAETTKMLDKLQDITFAEYSKELNTQISEPTMDFINNTIKTAEERIKEELGSKEEKK